MSKGFGLISIIITLAIIALLVFGAVYMNGGKKQNMIQQNQQASKDAAGTQNEYNQNLQNDFENFDTNAGVNYRSVQQKLK